MFRLANVPHLAGGRKGKGGGAAALLFVGNHVTSRLDRNGFPGATLDFACHPLFGVLEGVSRGGISITFVLATWLRDGTTACTARARACF